MKHRRHGRHAVKSTGGCMGMLAAAVAFGLLNMGSVSAAEPTRPDAGTLQQDLQTKKEFDKQDVSLGNADIQVEQEQRPSLDLPDTLKVQVNDFKITGQDIYSEETLKSLLADKKGKLVTFKDLQDGADTLSRYFRDKGYIAAHAYLPVQKIENGVVEYAVTVGRFDGITIQNNTKIHEGVIKRETAFLKKGDYLTRANLERAVWLLSDLAGADAKAVLTTGENPGTVHVTLDLNPHNGKQGLFSIDNYGNRSTGYNEYGLDYDFLNLAHEGDHLAVGITTTGNELFNWGANYTIPVIRDGMKLTAGYNVLTYQLGDIFEPLDGVGHSRVASLGLDYAIQRSQRHNLYTGIRYEYSDIQDEYRDFMENHSVKYNDKTGNAAVWSLYGDEQDRKGATDWRFEYKFGHIGNDALQMDKEIGGTYNAPTGTYNKIRANILRRQDLNDRTYLLLSARGQYAFNNLDSSEHFSLGGPYGVRAYPTSEASGDTGYLTRAELRWLLPLGAKDQQLHLASYLEHGGVWINKDSSINPGAKNHRNLQGIGVGLIWSRYEDWFLRADYAWKLGSEEPTSDTSHTGGRFWIRGGVYF
ncbi:ShlB/FhaC/HecB family hemolysin secretion/activation protein [Mitsuokella multacida]|uniref:ShlB/FhaC/HecB family hemolysin secretion/activation protein n=1 Tax=Mitsuokella multacida TaxID=52226 RepID=UPI0026DF4C93|nr:ShlB/FhaC/HecB family hemolysin secretion/activation protein [Mitsuokella multacida]